MSWTATVPIGRREMLRTLAFGMAVAAVPLTLARKTVAAVVAAVDVVVTAAQPLILQGPTTANFGTVTLEQGGQISLQGPVQLNAQSLVKQ